MSITARTDPGSFPRRPPRGKGIAAVEVDRSRDAENDLAHYAKGLRFVEHGGTGGRWVYDPDMTQEQIGDAQEMLDLIRRHNRMHRRLSR